MSLPTKIAVAALGSSAVVVGGYETIAYNAGTTSVFGISSKEKSEIQRLVKQESFKCQVLIKSSDNKFKPLDQFGNSELKGLLASLKEIKDTDCVSSLETKNEIIFEKTNNSQWKKMSEKDQIEYLINQDSFQCEVKVKKTENENPVDWKETDESDLPKLLEVLKSIKDSYCGGEAKKTLTLLKSTDSSSITTFLTEKQRIDKWQTDKKCTLKIGTQISSKAIEEKDDLDGLMDFLKEKIIADFCDSSNSNSQEIIVQKSKGNWYVTKDLIAAIKAKQWTYRTISIKDSNNGDKDFSFLNGNSLNILLKKIKDAYEEHCKSGTSAQKKTLTLKEKDRSPDSWDITASPSS